MPCFSISGRLWLNSASFHLGLTIKTFPQIVRHQASEPIYTHFRSMDRVTSSTPSATACMRMRFNSLHQPSYLPGLQKFFRAAVKRRKKLQGGRRGESSPAKFPPTFRQLSASFFCLSRHFFTENPVFASYRWRTRDVVLILLAQQIFAESRVRPCSFTMKRKVTGRPCLTGFHSPSGCR